MSRMLHLDESTLADILLVSEIAQALYAEAEMLDERRYRDWLECFTEDATYWMPVRSTRALNDIENEFTKPGEAALFDEDRQMLEMRVYKLETECSWSEDPPSRTRHYVSNVRIKEKHSDVDLTVSCNFLLYRSRLDTDEDLWAGKRLDRMHKAAGRWKISRREIYLDQTVLKSKNLSTFF
jgi:3-phenylpropionate/cinnamic acid dioxygenase small subunit